jgi:hypothetical protein
MRTWPAWIAGPALAALLLAVISAFGDTAPRPNAQQITEQLMEREIANYRQQFAQLVEKFNKLTDDYEALKKDLESCRQK